MDEKVTYYAMVFSEDTPDAPSGLARRRILPGGGIVDEALHKDLQWHESDSIDDWRRGEASQDLIEISEADAQQVMERFRRMFGSGQ
ncbi:hypothetical protein BKM31_50040 [[Actinomadura] parvosata subsp. kistnae]|uniref:Uncharacterized protein n=1 Tax=[Actinomadura] parvosata subsp. kistnae TaxID=1909395 RepID=A0A1V0AEL0_9ACTN|nr:hypothetical protein [Nonomuraea sp. ATCC 55076]AQZ68542.1 hypothetical protein BKM31_50040 [Nonomuraea sp. ATCC 55076]